MITRLWLERLGMEVLNEMHSVAIIWWVGWERALSGVVGICFCMIAWGGYE